MISSNFSCYHLEKGEDGVPMVAVNEHIRKLKAYEPGLQPKEGQEVIKLNTNENP